MITGRVLDAQGEPVSSAKVNLMLEEEELQEAEANSDGGYTIKVEREGLSDGLSLEIAKPCSIFWSLPAGSKKRK